MNREVAESLRECDPLEKLKKDLEVLCDGPSINLHFSFDGGWMSIRSHDVMIWSKSSVRGWQAVDGRARGLQLLSWLHEAAEVYREHLNSTDRKMDAA